MTEFFQVLYGRTYPVVGAVPVHPLGEMEEDDTIKEKRCPKCGVVFPASFFYIRGDGRLYPYCQPCQRIINKGYSKRKGK